MMRRHTLHLNGHSSMSEHLNTHVHFHSLDKCLLKNTPLLHQDNNKQTLKVRETLLIRV